MITPISWIKDYAPDIKYVDEKGVEKKIDFKPVNGTKEEIKALREENDAALRNYVDKITLSGSHVEEAYIVSKALSNAYVGEIKSLEKHPEFTEKKRWLVCQVDVGQSELVQIVAGIDNIKVGDKVVAILDGGSVPMKHQGNGYVSAPNPETGWVINKGTLGKESPVESNGMLCAIEELGLDPRQYGVQGDVIFVFPEDMNPEVGQSAAEALGIADARVEYEITSNRVDCFSLIGMAREAAATFDSKFVMPDNSVKGNGGDVNDYASVEVKDSDLCTRYCARVVTDIEIKPSPKWLQERLRSQQIRPINNIVDITNYVMEEYGQPMHAFDLEDVAGHKIIVRRAEDGEVFSIIDNEEGSDEEKTVNLDRDVLMICDGEKEIGIAGIKGGDNSKIKDSTKTILFEAACFDGTNIRHSSRRLNLATPSAMKFVKGLDPNLAIEAINRACHLIEELGCGKVVDGVIDVYPNPVKEKVLPFEPDKMNKLLGLDVSEEQMIEIFAKLEVRYNEADRTLIIPTFRQDLNCMADLAEEVARFYGYDNIPSTLPSVNAGIGGVSYAEEINRTARALVESRGFSQAMFYSFESPKVYDKLLISEDYKLGSENYTFISGKYAYKPDGYRVRDAVTISNPLGEDYSIMRTLPLNGILTSLSLNMNRHNKNVRLYELGKVYIPQELPLKRLPEEKEKLVMGMYGECDFFTLKGVIEELLEKYEFGKECEYAPVHSYPFLHPGRQAEILKGKMCVGFIGQIHPEVCENYEMKGEVYVAVLNMDIIGMLARQDIKYTGIAKHPASTRDLALVCNKSVYVGDIQKKIRKSAGKLLEKLELFDVYEGDKIDSDKKSVAYSLTFRAADRSLKSEEVDEAVKNVLSALEKDGIVLRS